MFVEQDEYEYMYTWKSERRVHIGHFLVKGGFNQGTGTRAMNKVLTRFEEEGADVISINMGGGDRTADWLTEKFGFTVLSVGSPENHDNPPVHAEKRLSK